MIILISIFFSISFCQWFELDHNGITRTYYVSYPDNENSDGASLIINMHGYGGNASQQMSYTQMDQFAHDNNMAVVYPNGLNNSWNVYTYWDNNPYDDVGFISLMIDAIAENFNIDLDKIYACGMSNGGYMSYRLACDLSDKIAAFGSVTGNLMLNSQVGDCQDQDRDIPIIHFHGTYDSIVNYFPPSFDGSLTVGESIEFWNEYNNLSDELVEQISFSVERYTYSSEISLAKFIHYKVYGGGHEWFNYNWGFNSSEELVNFFLNYRLSDFIGDDIILGDLNQDDTINIQDVILIINLILNSSFNSLADLNEDGEVDVLDVVYILNIILNTNN